MQLKPGIDPSRIGNGVCDLELNITECGFDGQDCALGALKCVVPAPELLGNGYCNGGDYNSAACNFDDGDCIDCNEIVPFPEKLGELSTKQRFLYHPTATRFKTKMSL
jgi:hypothetical protein